MILRLARPGEERRSPALELDEGDYQSAVADLYHWQFRRGSYFTSHLFALMQKADDTNLTRLALSFPFHALAFERWRASPTEREFFEAAGFYITNL